MTINDRKRTVENSNQVPGLDRRPMAKYPMFGQPHCAKVSDFLLCHYFDVLKRAQGTPAPKVYLGTFKQLSRGEMIICNINGWMVTEWAQNN